MKTNMTSKERILGTMDYEKVDYTPCSFTMFFNLTSKYKEQKDSIKEELNMGLDAIVNVGTLENSFHPDTKYSEWTEKKDGINYFNRKLETRKGSRQVEISTGST